jgi:molybdopterin-guanine dinucleotide biosynthesis protein A
VRSALVLAGGASSRFGRPKALIEFRGRPMIAWITDVVSRHADELLVSVADPDQADLVRAAVPRALVVQDEAKGRGPIEGLARGFEAAAGELVLVAPCDAPLLRPALHDALVTALGDHEAAVPRIEVFDPVRAVYRREAAVRVLREAAVPSPSALVDRLRTVVLDEPALRLVDPDLRSFLDVNGPEDLARASAWPGP